MGLCAAEAAAKARSRAGDGEAPNFDTQADHYDRTRTDDDAPGDSANGVHTAEAAHYPDRLARGESNAELHDARLHVRTAVVVPGAGRGVSYFASRYNGRPTVDHSCGTRGHRVFR